jgi:hypothetical protein
LLEDFFESEILKLKDSRQIIKDKIKVENKMSSADQVQYYSSWWYAAIHISTALPAVNSAGDIAQRLSIPLERVKEVLEFLLRCGLVSEDKNGDFQIGENRIHLGAKSSLLVNHHRNWRTESLKKLDDLKSDDLCYSGIIAISEEDAKKIKSILINSVKSAEPLIKDSPEENLYSLLIDFCQV